MSCYWSQSQRFRDLLLYLVQHTQKRQFTGYLTHVLIFPCVLLFTMKMKKYPSTRSFFIFSIIRKWKFNELNQQKDFTFTSFKCSTLCTFRINVRNITLCFVRKGVVRSQYVAYSRQRKHKNQEAKRVARWVVTMRTWKPQFSIQYSAVS